MLGSSALFGSYLTTNQKTLRIVGDKHLTRRCLAATRTTTNAYDHAV
jgi:hypothetical protein